MAYLCHNIKKGFYHGPCQTSINSVYVLEEICHQRVNEDIGPVFMDLIFFLWFYVSIHTFYSNVYLLFNLGSESAAAVAERESMKCEWTFF